jgi:hypothetical protein
MGFQNYSTADTVKQAPLLLILRKVIPFSTGWHRKSAEDIQYVQLHENPNVLDFCSTYNHRNLPQTAHPLHL